MNRFTDKDANFWKWGIYLAFLCFISVVGWSIAHLTPSLWFIALAMSVAGAAVSFVYTVFTTINSPTMRNRAWKSEGAIAISLAVSVCIHTGLSRRHDVAVQNKKANIEKEKREQARLSDQNQSLINILKEQQALIAQQNEMNRNVPWKNRQTLPPVSIPVAPTPTPEVSSEERPVMLSPEEIQEKNFWAVLIGIIQEIAAIVFSAIYFGHGLIQDRNKDGIPDWKEELDIVSNQVVSPSPSTRQPMGFSPPQGGSVPTGETHLKPTAEPASTTHRKVDLYPPGKPTATGGLAANPPQNPPKNDLDWIPLGGWRLPKIPNASWEEKEKGSPSRFFELWPDPKTVRKGYYGRIGVRKLKDLENLTDAEKLSTIRSMAERWINKKTPEAKNV